MADIKELQTRIALKYDSYTNWTKAPGKDLVLLPGEVGICEIQAANTASNVAPTVLFKVGGSKYPDGHAKAGQLMTFEDLPWASAKAADVYSWAKASDVVLEDKTIKFVGTNKTIAINYITPDEVNAITNPLAARIAAVENAVNGVEGTTGIKDMLESLDGRLDTLEGTGAGSINKVLADAKEYAEGQAAAAKTGAETTANAYTDAEVLKDRNRLDSLEAFKTAQENEYTALEGRVDTAEQNITGIETRIADVEGTLEVFFKDAAQDSNGLNDALDTLKDIQTFINTDGTTADAMVQDIAKNKQDISDNAAAISNLQTLTQNYGTVAETVNTLNDIVTAGADSNEALRQDIKAIQDIVEDDSVGNDVLAGSIQAIANKVNGSKTGLDAAHTELGDHEGRIAAIESDYLKLTDQIIFRCGSSTTNNFTVTA